VRSVSGVDVVATARQVLAIEGQALRVGAERIDSRFARVVDLLCNHRGRVVVMGMGKSGHVGRKIAATLASTGTPAFFVHPAEAGHGDLGMITPDDVVLAISQSGKSDELLRVLPYIKRHGVRIIAMTGTLDSPLAQHADATVDTSVTEEACPLGLAPTASTTLTLALGDALAVALLELRGFTAHDFAATHPHGTLGRRLLLTVDAVMVRDADVPYIASGATVREALVPMSAAGLGFVCVVRPTDGTAIGVFTDGDLRRTLDRDLDIRAVRIDDVMNTCFSSVPAQALAVVAVDLMERQKVSALPVLDESGRPVGALNMRILLQAGVI
jgi:arabinose-5-phosphate isomerase